LIKTMANFLNLQTFTDKRGNLTVIEKVIPFDIKRIFYIYGVDDSRRGGHRHHKTIQAAICLKGECKIFNNDGNGNEKIFHLNSPDKCLILNPEDWHEMYDFSNDAILMVLASEEYNAEDYIFTPYA
jgi:dTDP-4-dehydrorhamnose 3,5-epimerase-like enzyme